MNNLDEENDPEAEIHGDEEYDRKKCEAPDDVCSEIGCFEQVEQYCSISGKPLCKKHCYPYRCQAYNDIIGSIKNSKQIEQLPDKIEAEIDESKKCSCCGKVKNIWAFWFNLPFVKGGICADCWKASMQTETTLLYECDKNGKMPEEPIRIQTKPNQFEQFVNECIENIPAAACKAENIFGFVYTWKDMREKKEETNPGWEE